MPNNLALLTDLYQLTMAQAFWQSGKSSLQASFYMHFRENPFEGGYAIACGIAQLVEHIQDFAITPDDIDYLAGINAADGTQMFDREFLSLLPDLKMNLDVDAVPEGTAVFPYEPLIRVTGPITQCLLLETALLNIVNFQTLIATKAARICSVATGPVAEFGLRRAQGPNGGNLASRAAVIGGCASTSNVMAGKLYGIPVSGTHSHAWVMAFDSELEAFRSYANSFAHNCIFLVDTYDTFAGINNAITVAKEMELRGQRLAGVRIDSGDLAWISIKAREMLNAANLDYVKIFASNNLDEYTIQSLIAQQNAQIDAWGVGTRLACAYNQPALGGVYKLSAIKATGEQVYTPVLKKSEQVLKSTLPGILGLRRYFNADKSLAGDMIYNVQEPPVSDEIIDPFNELRHKHLDGLEYLELLQPLLRNGELVAGQADEQLVGQPAEQTEQPANQPANQASKQSQTLQARTNTLNNLKMLHPSIKRFLNPHIYPVGLEQSLLAQRDELLSKTKNI